MGIEFQPSKYFSILPEFNFTGKGYKFDMFSSQTDVRLNYLEIPVMLRPKMLIIKDLVELYAEVGPSIALV